MRFNDKAPLNGQPLRWPYFVTSFYDKTDNLERQVKLLSVLVDGCKKHPAYRAIRPATGRCKPCFYMWQARQELKELDK
jgi:hypothetical protein